MSSEAKQAAAWLRTMLSATKKGHGTLADAERDQARAELAEARGLLKRVECWCHGMRGCGLCEARAAFLNGGSHE